MFARIFEEMKEPFTDTITKGVNDLQAYHGSNLSNVIYTQTSNLPLEELTKTVSLTGSSTPAPVLRAANIKKGYSDKFALLENRQAKCENPGISDQFQQLSSLASSQNPKSYARCGWMYNTANPQDGRGAFGIETGPWKTSANGIWMWDLKAAKQKVHTDLCKGVKDCGDLKAYPYAGRCGYCKITGKAVPIVNGKIAYPYDPNCTCSAANLVANSTRCPIPVSGAAKQPCDPMENGSLSRDCIIQKVKQAGCSDKGTLSQALKSGSDMNYIDALVQTRAYQTYQQRAAVGFDEATLKSGKLTVAQALTEFQRLQVQAASPTNTGLRASARDLCIQQGEIDTYDFCLDLQDKTPPPYSLECLQKEFIRVGGQPAGKLYPSQENIVRDWNSLNTWLDVKKKMRLLKSQVESSDTATQAAGLYALYGIQPSPLAASQMPQMNGVEIFWFSHNMDVSKPTMFLGRRIRSMLPSVNQSSDLPSTQGQGTNEVMISFVYFTNLYTSVNKSIRIRIRGDDGYSSTLNRPMKNMRNLKTVADANELTRLDYFPPTTTTNTWACWALDAARPNILQGYWFQGHGGLYYLTEYQENCSPASVKANNNWLSFPSSMLNMVQESFAPMVSFEARANSYAYGCDFAFCDKRLGGHKMKWLADLGTPSWMFASSLGTRTPGMPVNKSAIILKPGNGIRSEFTMKAYSFLTMTLCVSFMDVPNNSLNFSPFFQFVTPNGKILEIRLVGTGDYKTGELQLFDNQSSPNIVKGGLFIKTGTPYLITLRMLRSNDSDIFSLNGVKLGCAALSDLQNSGAALKETVATSYANPRMLEDPNTPFGRTIYLRGNSTMNVFWLNFFDYKMDSKAIQREANQSWKTMWYL